MEAARFYADPPIEEIPATCGGCCACATCHIHLDDRWIDKLGKIDYNTPEANLLEYESKYKENVSRLACQIVLKPEHDGLIAHLLNDELL
jgi:2Fe-2S ferredoxin